MGNVCLLFLVKRREWTVEGGWKVLYGFFQLGLLSSRIPSLEFIICLSCLGFLNVLATSSLPSLALLSSLIASSSSSSSSPSMRRSTTGNRITHLDPIVLWMFHIVYPKTDNFLHHSASFLALRRMPQLDLDPSLEARSSPDFPLLKSRM